MIRAALLLVLLSTASVARAQDAGQTGWFVADTQATRFPGEKLAGQTFTAGSQVTVVVKDGALVRVTTGDRFGWVPASALTAVAPEGTATSAPLVVDMVPEGTPPQ